MKRASFLRTLGAVGASLSLPAAVAATGDSLGLLAKNSTTGKMVGYKDEPIPTVRIGLIGCGNRGKSLASMLHAMLRDRTAELVAVCDLLPRNTQAILDDVERRHPLKRTLCGQRIKTGKHARLHGRPLGQTPEA